MTVYALLWEILIFDSLRAFLSMRIYRKVIEFNESPLEFLIDQQEMRQFFRNYTKSNPDGNKGNRGV